MKILLCWFSRTGTTEGVASQAAELLTRSGHEVRSVRLEPRVDLPYPLWLALSFVPGSRFPLRTYPDPAGFDACLLALPKWTFSCPPVNAFLEARGRCLPPTALVVTCGGWDQERYATALGRRLGELGAEVVGTLLVKKKAAGSEDSREALKEFLARSFVRRETSRAPVRGPKPRYKDR